MARKGAKASSGLSAVRQYKEWVDDPSRTAAEENDTNPNGNIRDGQGHGSFHVGVSNDTTGTLRIFQGWTTTTMELVESVSTVADPISGRFTADIVVPVTRKFVRAAFVGTVGANYELGSYLLPRASIQFEQAGGAGGGGGGGVANRAAFATGQQDVASAGTAEQVASDVAVPDGFAVVVKGKSSNTGDIMVGNSQANAEDSTVAFLLSADQSLSLKVDNVNRIWIDAENDGEGVEYVVET